MLRTTDAITSSSVAELRIGGIASSPVSHGFIRFQFHAPAPKRSATKKSLSMSVAP